jgi:hypothetical protein
LEFKPGLEVTDSDLSGTVIAKSPREDEESPCHRGRSRSGQEEDLVVSQPAHLLSVLDRHQINAVNSAAKEIRRNYSKKVNFFSLLS